MEGEEAGLFNGGSSPAMEGQQRQNVLWNPQKFAGLIYQPLADGCIRVLKTDRLDDSNTLCCTLSNITLDDVAEYDAISYAWNNETLSVLINCNGQHLFVTPSLYEALLSLYVAGDKELLWADAVCINQSDSNEKAIQVQMMGKIYSMASTVIVWLGPRSIDSDMAMSHLEWLYHRINMLEEKVVEQTRDLDKLTSPRQDLEAVGIHKDDYLWEKIEQLLNRSWFKRLWTVQEVCLARYCVVACGSRLIRWDKLIALIRTIRQHRLLQMIQPDLQSFNSGIPFAIEYLDRMKTQIRRGIYPTLDQLMQYACMRETSNPLDKVYAVFGLVNSEVIKRIKIDYSEQSREAYWWVYLQMGHLLLEGSPSLYLLSYACSTERPNGLPSWCPNFNSEQEVEHLNSVPYRAGGVVIHPDQLPHTATSLDAKSIILRGAQIDKVSKIGASSWPWFPGRRLKEVYRAKLAFLTESLHITRKLLNGPPHTALGGIFRIPETLMRTLVGDYIYLEDTYAPSEEILGKMFHSLQKFVNRVCELGEPGDLEDWSMSGEEIDQKNRCLEAINSICVGRRFFTTSNGRLGMGPQRIEPCDIVCVFRGVPIPLILRPEPNGAQGEEIFKLIGEAYVHGVMDGEIFQAEDEGQMVPERLFTVA